MPAAHSKHLIKQSQLSYEIHVVTMSQEYKIKHNILAATIYVNTIATFMTLLSLVYHLDGKHFTFFIPKKVDGISFVKTSASNNTTEVRICVHPHKRWCTLKKEQFYHQQKYLPMFVVQ